MLFRSRQGNYKMSRTCKNDPTANAKYTVRWFAQSCKYWKTRYGGKIYWIISSLTEMYITVLTDNMFRNAVFSANKKIREERTSSSYTRSRSFCKMFVLIMFYPGRLEALAEGETKLVWLLCFHFPSLFCCDLPKILTPRLIASQKNNSVTTLLEHWNL